MKTTYTKDEIRSACGKATDYTFDFDYIDLLQDLAERAIENGDIDDAIIDAIDEGMIYTADQWTAYKHFCNPGDDITIMWEGLENDVFTVIRILTEGANND